MDNNRKERFWTGPVLTRRHAKKIIGRLVIVLGLVSLLMAGSFIGGADSSEVAAFAILVLLTLGLKLTQHPAVAAIALIFTALPPLFGLVGGFAILREGSISMGMYLAMALPWVPLPLACFRGFVATRALRNLSDESVADTFA